MVTHHQPLTIAPALQGLGKYEVLRPLGRGATSEVYLARDRSLDRLVALKLLGETRPSMLARFRRDARLAARLDNPSIVTIYELDEIGGRPYIAMEYIDGGSLADARLEARELVGTIREVARALHAAHRVGIVHRDIKPANILLDRCRRPFVTDFGLARDLGVECGSISVDGQVVGTPACMPPEQARGELCSVDPRSDVYALGATMFYTLARRWPFEGDNVIDVLHAVIHQPPPRLRSVMPAVSRRLDAIVAKCLAKDRDDRYGSMCELIADLGSRFVLR